MQRLLHVSLDAWKPEAKQTQCAIRHVCTPLRVIDRFQALPFLQSLQCRHHIGCRIDKRSVEVEEHGGVGVRT